MESLSRQEILKKLQYYNFIENIKANHRNKLVKSLIDSLYIIYLYL